MTELVPVTPANSHPAATSLPDGSASLAPLPHTGGAGGGLNNDDSLPPHPGEKPVPTFSDGAERKSRFLERLSLNGNVRSACRAVAITPVTAYRWRRACPHFAKGWDAALVVARVAAEEVLADRALNGVEETVFYHGEEVATRIRYDSRLLLAHLARLDKKAQDRNVAEAAADFDAALELFAQTGEMPGMAADHSAQAGEGDAQGEEDACGPDDYMWYGNRLERMDAARPPGTPLPHESATPERDVADIEYAQMLAFEAGEADWWLAGTEEWDGAEEFSLRTVCHV